MQPSQLNAICRSLALYQPAKPKTLHMCSMCDAPFSSYGLLEKHETRCFMKERRKRNVDDNVHMQMQLQPAMAPVVQQLVFVTELVENTKKRAKLDPTEFLTQRYPDAADFTLWKQLIVLHVEPAHLAIVLQQQTYVQGFMRLLTELMFPEKANPDRCPVRTLPNPDKHLYCFKRDADGENGHWTVWTPSNFAAFILLMDRAVWQRYLEYEKQELAHYNAQQKSIWHDSEEFEQVCYHNRKKILHANLTQQALCEAVYAELYRGMI